MAKEEKKNSMYRIYELRDDITNTMTSTMAVIEQQAEIVRILKEAVEKKETKEDITEFIKISEEEIAKGRETYGKSSEKALAQKEYLMKVIALYEAGRKGNATEEEKKTSELTVEITEYLLKALGVLNI